MSWWVRAQVAGQGAVDGLSDAKRLFEDLLGDYNKLARPVERDSDAVKIQFKLKLLQILDVHEKMQIFSTNGWLIHIWDDYRLSWDPKEYGNVTVLHIPAELVWLPDIILYNNADGSPQVTTLTKAHVYSSGRVVWEPPVIYNSMCEIDIEWFPLDEQFCKMKFGSWTYYGSQLNMKHLATDRVEEVEEGDAGEKKKVWRVQMGIDITEYQESVEWDLMSVVGTRHENWYPCCNYPYVDITYYINIRRKTLFYTINLITPCVGITFLTGLVFYLPSDSNNKISLCVSVLVSLTVFFLLLIEIIPPTSLTVPLIGRYLMFTMILVSLSVCATVFILNVHYRSGVVFPMPAWLRRLFIEWLPRYLLMPRPEKRYADPARRHFSFESEESSETGIPRDFFLGVPPSSSTSLRVRESGCSVGSADTGFPSLKSRRDRGSSLHALHSLDAYKTRACKNVCFIASQLQDQEVEENARDDWKFLAQVCDRILLIIFVGAIVFGTGGMLLASPSVWDTRPPVTDVYKL